MQWNDCRADLDVVVMADPQLNETGALVALDVDMDEQVVEFDEESLAQMPVVVATIQVPMEVPEDATVEAVSDMFKSSIATSLKVPIESITRIEVHEIPSVQSGGDADSDAPGVVRSGGSNRLLSTQRNFEVLFEVAVLPGASDEELSSQVTQMSEPGSRAFESFVSAMEEQGASTSGAILVVAPEVVLPEEIFSTTEPLNLVEADDAVWDFWATTTTGTTTATAAGGDLGALNNSTNGSGVGPGPLPQGMNYLPDNDYDTSSAPAFRKVLTSHSSALPWLLLRPAAWLLLFALAKV